MNDLVDTRVQKAQTIAVVAGTGVVAVVASTAVLVVGTSLIAASVVALGALFAVNFLVPVTARRIALWRQRSLTALAETFSEETIRDDERKEMERVRAQEEQYVSVRAELEGLIEEWEKQLNEAKRDEEKVTINAQIAALHTTIQEGEQDLRDAKENLSELVRVNKIYIGMHRTETAKAKARGAQRSVEELQAVETARTAILTRMRAAAASRSVASMGKKPALNNELPKLRSPK